MTPKKIALLTDSSADLRWETAEENNIFFVPLRILCRDGEYLDGVDIRGTDVYQRLHAGELPQTSLPRVEDFAAKLHEIFEKGYDGVIAVMLSSGLSGTCQAAMLAAQELREKYPMQYSCFTPQWSSFRALKKHFCANNQSIELVKV